MAGTVVTFYSYKGGVGRTFALVNTGAQLAKWGYRVLCVDWDLDAPGLPYYFNSETDKNLNFTNAIHKRSGIVDIINKYSEDNADSGSWKKYICDDYVTGIENLHVLKAGNEDQEYLAKLHKIDWRGLYDLGFGNIIEEAFTRFREMYDYILVDARTGVTDFSAIVNAQIPDILALFFTANEQSIRGCLNVAKRSEIARNKLSTDKPRLLILPVPSRFETQVEFKISREWQDVFSRSFQKYYRAWAPPNFRIDELVEEMTIPYVPYWSFGEKIALHEDKRWGSSELGRKIEMISALLAHRLDNLGLLADSPDSYVRSAEHLQLKKSRSKHSTYLSYHSSKSGIANQIVRGLRQRGFLVRKGMFDIASDATQGNDYRASLDRSMHMIALMYDKKDARHSQEYEIDYFLKQAITERETRLFIPIRFGRNQVSDMKNRYSIEPIYVDESGEIEEVVDTIDQILHENFVSEVDEDIGLEWILNQTESSEWVHVWEREFNRNPTDTRLIDVALKWIENNVDHQSWVTVWLRLVDVSPKTDELLYLGYEKLRKGMSIPGWTYLWHRLVDEQYHLTELLKLGREWLSGREDLPEWNYVWQHLVNLLPSEKRLHGLGLDWLNLRYQNPGWAYVWRTLYDLEFEHAKLTEMAIKWLADRRYMPGREIVVSLLDDGQRRKPSGKNEI